MPVYFVTYDLIAKKGETRDYKPIWDAIDTFPNFQALYSVFLVQAANTRAVEITITPSLRKTDRYFIDRVRAGDEHKYRAIKGINQWLKDHPLA